MKVGIHLSIETSGPVGSVAVSRDGRVVAEVTLEGRHHARTVVGGLMGLLAETSIDRDDLEGVVVGAGPGSFTGARIGAATAKGLAHALRIPMYAESSLGAAALSDRVGQGFASAEPVDRVVLFDARGERVYAAGYRIDAEGCSEILAPTAGEIGPLLESRFSAETWFLGDGAERHRATIEERGYRVVGPPAGIPTAGALLLLFHQAPSPEPVEDLGGWEPDYLRASSAEREWQR